MNGPVSQQHSRETVVDLLLSKIADVLPNIGFDVEPVEVVNAALQYVTKTMKFVIRHSSDHATRMRNQKSFCDALDLVKMMVVDDTDGEQVN